MAPKDKTVDNTDVILDTFSRPAKEDSPSIFIPQSVHFDKLDLNRLKMLATYNKYHFYDLDSVSGIVREAVSQYLENNLPPDFDDFENDYLDLKRRHSPNADQ